MTAIDLRTQPEKAKKGGETQDKNKKLSHNLASRVGQFSMQNLGHF